MQLSPFEVHAAVQRLIAARLLTEHTGTVRPIMAAPRAFLISGPPTPILQFAVTRPSVLRQAMWLNLSKDR